MMGANYRKPNQEEMKITFIPKWLRILMIIVKGSMVLIPFIISSIAMFYESNMSIMESGLWNCIWLMSLLHILNYADEK
tara:strand:- start:509 stop:745 length:237 start_codon:yes stop_codon:yes gene_type:complete